MFWVTELSVSTQARAWILHVLLLPAAASTWSSALTARSRLAAGGWACPHSKHFTAVAICFHHKVLLFSLEGTDFNALIFRSGNDKTCSDLKKKSIICFFSTFSCFCMVVIHLKCMCKSYRKPSIVRVCSKFFKQQIEI